MSVEQIIQPVAGSDPRRLRRRTALARAYIGLGSVVAAFVAAGATIVWAFLSVPNTPLP